MTKPNVLKDESENPSIEVIDPIGRIWVPGSSTTKTEPRKKFIAKSTMRIGSEWPQYAYFPTIRENI